MSKKNPKVDAFIKNEDQWSGEFKLLRQIALDCSLEEDFKWRFPCYSHEGKNVIILQAFKNSCALMFFKGHLLKDSKGLLKAPGENSQTARRFDFTSVADVKKVSKEIKAYIKEAMSVADTPTKTEKNPIKKHAIPAEFKEKLDENKKLKTAFESLTPGRQRLYLMHFSSAKQSATRTARVEKCIPKILKGQGLTN